MTLTIEELEALKEGTTPGPWGHTSLGYEAEKYPVYGNVPGDEVALVRRQDWELVSAAPDLMDALIAEKRKHDELRQQIGSLIGKLETRAEKAHRNRAYAAAVAFRETAHNLTRILETTDGPAHI